MFKDIILPSTDSREATYPHWVSRRLQAKRERAKDTMNPRSELRVREHSDPERKGELIVQVVRGDEVVANIYGSREGIQIMSPLFKEDFHFIPASAIDMPAVIIPLLKPGEPCPWCSGKGQIEEPKFSTCPICQGKHNFAAKPGRGKTK